MKNKEAKSVFSSLEDFSSAPPPELWANIEAELDKPKKKKRPIIWWWAVACLVTGLSIQTISYINFNQENNQELIIRNKANEVVLENDSKEGRNANKNESSIRKASVETKQSNVNEIKSENLNSKERRISLTNSNSVVAKTIPLVSSKINQSNENKNSKRGKNNQFIVKDDDKTQSNAIIADKNVTVGIYNSTSGIVLNKISQVSNSNTKGIINTENSTISVLKQNKESVKNISSKSIPTNQNSEVSGFNNNKAIVENTSIQDSLTIIEKEVTELENALAELDKDKANKETSSEVIDKWSLQVFAGVMSSENYSNEKALGRTVESKQSNSYGVKANYKLNKKWVISSGFKINELGQTIDGVSYYDRHSVQSLNSGEIPVTPVNGVNGNQPEATPSVNNSMVYVSSNENYLFASNSTTATGLETGNVSQNLKYFEMPLEISYALLIKKKASINMNTGGFVGKLISNEVLLNGSEIGGNKNAKKYVYGTFLSSTLQYEFYKKTIFFIEPGMNYYINPLENQYFNQFQWMFNFGLNVPF